MIKFKLFSAYIMFQVGVCFSFNMPVDETFLKNVIEPQLKAHQESMDQQKSFDQQKQVHQESFECQPRVYKEAIDDQWKFFELQKQVHAELHALQLRLINLNFATEVSIHSNLSNQSLSIFLELKNMNKK